MMSGGSGTGFPLSSMDTKTRCADDTCTTFPVRRFSASTRTPTSMLERPTWFTEAFAVTRSPTYTGARNESSSTNAVTTRLRAWRVAAAPAQASMSFITSPPCTFPYGFASDGSIVRAMTVFDPDTGLPSTTGEIVRERTHTSGHVRPLA